jgi:hypothetical protein
MLTVNLLWVLAVVGLGVLVALSWSVLRRWELSHRLLMAICACLGVWSFTLFGRFHDHGAFGHINFHSHDCYHYYFGSKYLKEWGYDGMYVTTVEALEEIGHEEPRKAIRFERIRDLRGSARFLRRDDFLPLAEASRARFTTERWNLLKKDLSFLRDKEMNNGWWQNMLLDSGFNPPPSYAVISSKFSNAIPFNEGTWKWLGAIDFVLLGLGVGIICYAVGPVPSLFALVILGNTPFRTYDWTGGSFMRQLWVFFLIIGLAGLARRRWVAAGAGLGACTAAVFFPVFFLFGATASVGFRAFRTGSRVAVTRLVVAATVVIVVLVGLSVVTYGMGPWGEWLNRIEAHGATFFDNHIGLKKITTYAPEVGRQAFGASDVVYPEWNRALVARALRARYVDLLLAIVLSIWALAGCSRARPAEASLVAGSGLLVFWTMPASYYTIYVGVFAAFMLANRSTSWARLRFMVFCAAVMTALLVPRYEHDLITQSVLLSAWWIVTILIFSSLYWLEHPAIPQTPRQRAQTVAGAALVASLLLVTGWIVRDRHKDPAFLPRVVLRDSRVVDTLDVGPHDVEAAHQLEIAEALRVPRSLMDTSGYLVNDECGILRKDGVLRYDLAPAPHGGRLVIRTDSFYRGELLGSVNGRSLPAVHLEPRRTLFAYLEIPLPSDLGDEPLHIQQTTTASDVGVFTVFLLAP